MNMKKNFIVDLIALAVYIVVANPLLTGIDLHEWMGLGILVIIFVHFVAHLDWIIEVFRTDRKQQSFTQVGNLVIDILALITLLVVVVSGLGISGAILPVFGYYMEGYYFWDPLHLISAKLLLAIIVVHVVVHVRWLISFIRKSKEDDDNGRAKI